MKRHGFLFEKAFSRENLYQAYCDASRHKHGRRACFQFARRLAFNLDRLHEAIHSGTYKPRPYYAFTVYEPKPRVIYAPSFGDLVVQHAIYRVIYSIFDRTFIDQSYACRVGMGTHKAADYAQAALQQSARESYSIKLDIRKFFYRIDRAVLRLQIERKIKDKRFVDVMMQFAEYGEPIGIPIGNLVSQIYALIYLNPLDHFIKRTLRIRRYCRYVDDFILFGLTRSACIEALASIKAFLVTLGLQLSRFTIARTSRGVNFVGYRTWASRRFIRRHSIFKFRRAAIKGRLDSVCSTLGHARHTHSLRHLIGYLKEHSHALHRLLPQIYRRLDHAGA